MPNLPDCFDCYRVGSFCDFHCPVQRCSDCEQVVEVGCEVRIKGRPYCYDCADDALGDRDLDDLDYGPPDSDPYDVDRDEYEPGGRYWLRQEDTPSLEDSDPEGYRYITNNYGEGY